MGQPVKINNFNIDLEYSIDKREDEIFTRFYNKAFPNIQKIEFIEDLQKQKQGIDKIIYFKSGKTISIDEKKRRKWYGDILLELWSVYEHKKRGWLFTCQCDYIVYAVMPEQKVFLLPSLLLKKAWNTNKDKWLKYKEINAQNKGYVTKSIAVPVNELLEAIKNEMVQVI
jgi:hypothetical protein